MKRQKSSIKAYQRSTESRGSVLLIALLLLAAVALSTVYLSLVLLNEIKSTRYSDNGTIAIYVGESAIERALWRLQSAESSGTFGNNNFFTDQLSNGKSLCGADDGGGEGRCVARCSTNPATANFNVTCNYDADCTAAGAGSTCSAGLSGADPERTYDHQSVTDKAFSYTRYDLLAGRSTFTKLYDPDLAGLSNQHLCNAGTGLCQLRLAWYVDQCTGPEQAASLTVTYQGFSIASASAVPLHQTPVGGSSGTVTFTCPCTLGGGASQDIGTDGIKMVRCSAGFWDAPTSFNLADTNYYRLKITAPATVNVRKVTIDNNGSYFPDQVEINAKGNYRTAQSVVKYMTSWQDSYASSSSLFNHEN